MEPDSVDVMEFIHDAYEAIKPLTENYPFLTLCNSHNREMCDICRAVFALTPNTPSKCPMYTLNLFAENYEELYKPRIQPGHGRPTREDLAEQDYAEEIEDVEPNEDSIETPDYIEIPEPPRKHRWLRGRME